MRRGLGHLREAHARLTGRRFYCAALAGQSAYNICVNCDLTVSCNCQDYDGSGQIGSLEEHSLEELFAGPVARRFRRDLAAGRLPLDTCSRCPELRLVDAGQAEQHVHEYRLPHRGMMVENSVCCNLDCVSCAREGVSRIRARRTMSLDDVRRVAAVLGRLGIESISYYNLGEPFLTPRILDELQILREHNPTAVISSSSNGVLLDSDRKREAALLLDDIYFSIDGPSTDVVTRYQRGSDFDRAYANLRALRRYRDDRGQASPRITWKYVLFRWNDHPALIKEALRLAREAEVDALYLWPTFSPPQGLSLRYWLHPYYRTLGRRGRYGIEVDMQGVGGDCGSK
ncbi:MAG: radical SAM protein [Deltaproteobacteria bacterium]|nr:radical SAM protein [Deltaproteobacteria bacterium]